ncbi:MAG: ABC transporter substrate-binding protein, partial [Planctomycetota bacterium]
SESLPAAGVIDIPALEARAGWSATLVHESDSGIWNTGPLKCFPQYGFPELYALDDKGRCTILVGYSGNYTANLPFQEREWLGDLEALALEHADGEPEFYTGGKRGNLYQVRAHADASFDTKRIGQFPAEEIHILQGGDLDATTPGNELLVFTHPGNVYLVDRALTPKLLAKVEGRVRQTVLLTNEPGSSPWIAGAARSGELYLMRLSGGALETRAISSEPCGFGRLALAPSSRAGQAVLYATRDDGLVLRFEQRGDAWQRELVYAGEQGPRGIAAGRFDADPALETIAVFGYSSKVELLSRRAGEPWRAETILTDRDKGHWLETVELDGRNATDELLCSGYGKRVLLLARPPGYGLVDVPAVKSTPAETGPRVAVMARPEALGSLSPLSYRGGFETKTFVYETLVTRDAAGRLAPGLAEAWRCEDGGRRWLFTARRGARFHDGSAVDAEALRVHVERWAGLPESAWLGAGRHVVRAGVSAAGELVLELHEPYYLPPDLCAINPTSVLAPAAFDDEGRFTRPLGSGPYRFERADPGTKSAWLARVDGPGGILLRCFASAQPTAPLASLLAGEVDVVADGWYRMLPRAELTHLAADERFELVRAPGSIVRWLAFASERGPTRELGVRQAIARAVQREELVAEVEHGYATPCHALFAPSLRDWPGAAPHAAEELRVDAALRLVGLRGRDEELLAVLARQLARAGMRPEVVTLPTDELARVHAAREFDLRLAESYGLPYDPELTLASVLRSPRIRSEERPLVGDAELDAAIDELGRTLDPAARLALYARLEARVTAGALLVPLFVPERLALVRRGTATLELDSDVYRLRLRAPRS